MATQVEITSYHSWNKDNKLTLFVEDNKVVKHTWSSKNVEEAITNHVADAAQIFAFTGSNPSYLTATGDYSIAEIYSLIYSIPFSGDKCRFISLQTCNCNMGNCGAVMQIVPDKVEFNTIGDLMACWGQEKTADGFTWFEYPDSVYLYVDKSPQTVKLYENGCHKSATTVNLEEMFGTGAKFYTWYYSR